jgi:hypothetical protein
MDADEDCLRGWGSLEAVGAENVGAGTKTGSSTVLSELQPDIFIQLKHLSSSFFTKLPMQVQPERANLLQLPVVKVFEHVQLGH